MASIGTNVNCGFARVAMKELSENVDEFKRLFQHPLQIPDEYFDSMYGGKKSSRYIVQCNQMKAAFLKRWQPSNARDEYKATFSLLQWDRLAQTERVKHSLEKCNACFCNYYTIQKTFPLKPCYTPCEINITHTRHKHCAHTRHKHCAHTRHKHCAHTRHKQCVHTRYKHCAHTRYKHCAHTRYKHCAHTRY